MSIKTDYSGKCVFKKLTGSLAFTPRACKSNRARGQLLHFNPWLGRLHYLPCSLVEKLELKQVLLIFMSFSSQVSRRGRERGFCCLSCCCRLKMWNFPSASAFSNTSTAALKVSSQIEDAKLWTCWCWLREGFFFRELSDWIGNELR